MNRMLYQLSYRPARTQAEEESNLRPWDPDATDLFTTGEIRKRWGTGDPALRPGIRRALRPETREAPALAEPIPRYDPRAAGVEPALPRAKYPGLHHQRHRRAAVGRPAKESRVDERREVQNSIQTPCLPC